MNNAPSKIFVYGTLKPGGRNYHLAQGVTGAEAGYLEGYTLLHFDPEGYPAMVPGEGRVYGFVLTFADIEAALPPLDALEGCDLTPPEYERLVVAVQPSGERVWTYVYINQVRLSAEGTTPVDGGNWPFR